MNEVYKAMQALQCVWHQVNNYRVLCLWKYTSGIVPKAVQTAPSPTRSAIGSVSGRYVFLVVCVKFVCLFNIDSNI